MWIGELRSTVRAAQGQIREWDEYSTRLDAEVQNWFYEGLKSRGWLTGMCGRVVSSLLPCVKKRMIAEAAVSATIPLAAVVESDHDNLFRYCDGKDVPGAIAICEDGERVYEVVLPYGDDTRSGEVARHLPHFKRQKALGPYMRYVVDRLVAHFDPEDRGSCVGRKAMRKYAYNLMNEHGVRAYDIALNLDNIVLAAVVRVDANWQARAHQVVLELSSERSFHSSSLQ